MKFRSIELLEEESLQVLKGLNSARIPYLGPDDKAFDKWRLSLKETGIYGIFVDDKLTYIGKARTPAARLRDHFLSASDTTYTKNRQVEECLTNHRKVEVAFAPVPAVIYSSIEELIIKNEDPDWNFRSS